MDCPFCAIVAGEIAADVVLDEADFLAFLDRRPLIKGHTLIVPKRHVPTLLDLPPELHAGLTEAAQRLAGAVVAGLGSTGSFVALNNVVSQSVPHLHVHVVPRTRGDGLRGFFWPRTTYASADEARSYAAQLASALAARAARADSEAGGT